MEQEWKSLLIVLKGIRSKETLISCSSAILEELPSHELPLLIHELVFEYVLEGSDICLKNGSYLLEMVCSHYDKVFINLLMISASDGDLTSHTNIDVDALLASNSFLLKSTQTDSHTIKEEKSKIYNKKWFKKQQQRIRKIVNDKGLVPVEQLEADMTLVQEEDLVTGKNISVMENQKSSKDLDFSELTSETWFARIFRFLLIKLTHFDWSIRYGAAVALSSILKGLFQNSTGSETKIEIMLPKFLLNDILSIGLTVLVLDRFIDFEELVTKENQNKLVEESEIGSLNEGSFPVKTVVTALITEAIRILHKEHSFTVELFLDQIKAVSRYISDWSVSYGGLLCLSKLLCTCSSVIVQLDRLTEFVACVQLAISNSSLPEMYQVSNSICHEIFSIFEKESDKGESLFENKESVFSFVTKVESVLQVISKETGDDTVVQQKLLLCFSLIHCMDQMLCNTPLQCIPLQSVDTAVNTCCETLLAIISQCPVTTRIIDEEIVRGFQRLFSLISRAIIFFQSQKKGNVCKVALKTLHLVARITQCYLVPGELSFEFSLCIPGNQDDGIKLEDTKTPMTVRDIKKSLRASMKFHESNIRCKALCNSWKEIFRICVENSKERSMKDFDFSFPLVTTIIELYFKSNQSLPEFFSSDNALYSILLADQEKLQKKENSFSMINTQALTIPGNLIHFLSSDNSSIDGITKTLLKIFESLWNKFSTEYEMHNNKPKRSADELQSSITVAPPKKKMRFMVIDGNSAKTTLATSVVGASLSSSNVSSQRSDSTANQLATMLRTLDKLMVLHNSLIFFILSSNLIDHREILSEWNEISRKLYLLSKSTHTENDMYKRAIYILNSLHNFMEIVEEGRENKFMISEMQHFIIPFSGYIAERQGCAGKLIAKETLLEVFYDQFAEYSTPGLPWNDERILKDLILNSMVYLKLNKFQIFPDENWIHSGKRVWQVIYIAHKIIYFYANNNLNEEKHKAAFYADVGKFLSNLMSHIGTANVLDGVEEEEITLTRSLFIECLLLLKLESSSVGNETLHQLLKTIGTVLRDHLFDQHNAHSLPSRRNVAHFYQDIVISLAESVALSAFDLWLTIGVKGIGDYQHDVRLFAVNGFRLLVPLAPLAMNLHKRCNSISPISNTSQGLFQELLTKSNPRRLNESTDVLDQTIVRILITLNPIFQPCSTRNGLQLRSYQWDGISWWTMLRRCGLSGILADEMGLGKTLQALSCLAVLRVEQLIQSESIPEVVLDSDSLRTQLLSNEMRPCLIVCPASLTFHWQAEILKYFESSNLMKAIICTNEHFRDFTVEKYTKIALHEPNVFIVSYDMLRKHASSLGLIVWDMVIVDEAHMIRNPVTVVAKSIFQLQARYRLALTGTPIQNQVDDLWSLMNFLMPDYLGDFEPFRKQFVHPIKASVQSMQWLKSNHSTSSSSSSSTSKDMMKAMDISSKGIELLRRLHKQVLPFILRRLKEDCIKDLPKKTILDILCPLSKIQSKMYEDFQKKLSFSGQELDEAISTKQNTKQESTVVEEVEVEGEEIIQLYEEMIKKPSMSTAKASSSKRVGLLLPPLSLLTTSTTSSSTTINPLQALSCLKLLSIHPALVLDTQLHAAYYEKLVDSLDSSGKFQSLTRLLLDCNIVNEDDYDSEEFPSCQEFYSTLGAAKEVEENDENTATNISARPVTRLSTEKEDSDDDDNENDDEGDEGDEGDIIKKQSTTTKAMKKNLEGISIPSSISRKCLIFAHHKKCLDFIEEYILQKYFPNVKYGRLDGSLNPEKRFRIAQQFNQRKKAPQSSAKVDFNLPIDTGNGMDSMLPEDNISQLLAILQPETTKDSVTKKKEQANDDSIRILLLTTRSSGLGLNLSAADTVIFIEHDWNPFVDLQAMDRVHRLGQENPVTVYRLISESSVESRILSLQNFKSKISDEVMEGDPSSISATQNWQDRSLGQELWNSLTTTQ